MKNDSQKNPDIKPDTSSKVDSYGVDLTKSYIDTCSAHDCTGLIPSLPQSNAEIEAYDEVYHFLPDANVAKNK